MNRRRDLRVVRNDCEDKSIVIDIDDNMKRRANYLEEQEDENYETYIPEVINTQENPVINPEQQEPSLDELLGEFFEGQDTQTLEQMKMLLDLFKQIQGPVRFIQQIQGPLRFIQQIQGPLRLIRQLQGPLQIYQQMMIMQNPLNAVARPMITRQLQYHTQRRLQEQFKKQIEGALYQQVYGMLQKQIGYQIKEQLGRELKNQIPNLLNNFLNNRRPS